jgi:hypothetical protein
VLGRCRTRRSSVSSRPGRPVRRSVSARVLVPRLVRILSVWQHHTTLAHKHIAEHCFSQLNKLLHYNICNLTDASLFNHEVSDLLARVNQHISAALRYSCRYWPAHWLEHLREASPQAQVPVGLDRYCRQHLLHWIEVLSLTKDMNAVQQATPELISMMHVRF